MTTGNPFLDGYLAALAPVVAQWRGTRSPADRTRLGLQMHAIDASYRERVGEAVPPTPVDFGEAFVRASYIATFFEMLNRRPTFGPDGEALP